MKTITYEQLRSDYILVCGHEPPPELDGLFHKADGAPAKQFSEMFYKALQNRGEQVGVIQRNQARTSS